MSGPGQGRWEVMPAHPEQVPGCGKGEQVNPWGGKKNKNFFRSQIVILPAQEKKNDKIKTWADSLF